MMLNSKESKKFKDIFQKDVANLRYISLEQEINVEGVYKDEINGLLKIVTEDWIEDEVKSYFEEDVKYDKKTKKLITSKIALLNLNVKNESNNLFQDACKNMRENVYILNEILDSYILDYNNNMILSLCFNIKNTYRCSSKLNKLLESDGYENFYTIKEKQNSSPKNLGYQKEFNIFQSFIKFDKEIEITIKLSETDLTLNLKISYDKNRGMKEAYNALLKKAVEIYVYYIRGMK